MVEIALITPPIGFNVYVMHNLAPEVELVDIFKGIFPFWLAMGVALFILVLFPDIALLLPNTMFN